jgi:hypothetical protein
VVLVVGLDEVLENTARFHEVDSLAVVEARVGQSGDTSVGVDLEEPSGNVTISYCFPSSIDVSCALPEVMSYDEAQAQAQATGPSHSIAARGERDNSRLLLLRLVEADGSNVVG